MKTRRGFLNKRLAFVPMISLLLPGAVAPAQAGPFDSWGYRMKIAFTGYNKADALTNFPVLAVFSNAMLEGFAFHDFASTNGADLRFTASNETTELNYEIEQWNTNGQACIWVQVPLITGTNDFIYAYWGKPDVARPAYATNGSTWSEGYHAVWHMAESSPRDSTSNRYDAIGTSLVATNGVVGRAQHFRGNPSKAQINSAIAITTNQLTLEVFANTTSTQPDIRPFESGLSPRLILRWNYTEQGRLRYHDGTDVAPTCGSGLNNGKWHHVAFLFNQVGNTGSIYQAGTWVGGGVYNSSGIASSAYIGCRYDGASLNFIGGIDEFRISKVLRSPAWVWATWCNMQSNSLFQAYTEAGIQATSGSGNDGTLMILH